MPSAEPSGPEAGLTGEQLAAAAAGDLNVLAVLMVVGSTVFSLVNKWLGTMSWVAVALAIASTLTWSIGLLRRSQTVAAFVKIGFGVSGLAAPLVAVVGIGLGLVGFGWGWALLGAAVIYFGFSVLGLEILDRAQATGVVDPL